MVKMLLFSLTFIGITLISYYIGHATWQEGIGYTFPLFSAMLGGAIFSALVFDGYIFKGIFDV